MQTINGAASTFLNRELLFNDCILTYHMLQVEIAEAVPERGLGIAE